MADSVSSGVVPLEGTPARRHLVEDRAEGELVGAEVDRLSARLLRRHVADRSQDGSRSGPDRDRRRLRERTRLHLGGRELGEAEVQDLDEPVLRDHDVLGLQVPVDDPALVRAREPIGGLCRDRQQPARGERPFEQQLAEC